MTKDVKHFDLNISNAIVFLNTNILNIITRIQKFTLQQSLKHKEWFFNTQTFSNYDNNKFILSLRKYIYPSEYMNDLEKFNQRSLPEKEFAKILKYSILENIMICMFKSIHYC